MLRLRCLQGGCTNNYLGQMAQGDCLLLSRNCTLPAGRSPAPGAVSGFPVHNFPGPVLEAFPTYLAQAILGADFACPMSEVDGICAFSSIVSAMSNCIRMGHDCLAVTVYANGTNGCSQKPLAVLKSEVPTNENAFVSPDAYSVVLTESAKSLRNAFMFADAAQQDQPSDEEIRATGADAPDSLAYKGCHVGANALYRGDVVATLDGVPSPQACCRECTAFNIKAGRRVCTVFNYCGQRDGCLYAGKQRGQNVTLALRQCELRLQPLSNALNSLPPALLASGPDVPFVAGAPNTLWAPQLPGFRRVIGETIVLSGAYPCEGSLRPETGECVKAGSLGELADQCLHSEECATFAYRLGPQPSVTTRRLQQNGTAATPSTIGSFKAASLAPNQVVFPTAVLYIKDAAAGGSGSASGLSSGAVAGITVGAVAGAAALTTAAWLLLQRAQRRRRQQAQLKDCEDATASGAAAGCAGSCTRSIGCASTASSVHCSTAGRTVTPPLSGVGTLSTSGDALPELVAHVAAHDAAQVSHRPSSPESSSFMEWEESMLPPHLREWVVDSSQVHYLRRADGKLWDLGSGASGKVYRVEYRGELLAAKEVELGANQSLRETFVTEARMLHQLRHPNVVGFAGVTFHGSTRGVVLMELCEGRDLHSALQVRAAGSQERLFSWGRRGKRVALDVAKAMNFLHQNNVVHMDIKSPNILLTASGTAKLADVGFSKTKPNTYLSTVSLVGTFAWAAPELLLGSERPTAAIDVYSFGVVLYEIITGERPQRGQLRMPRDDECPEEVRALMLDCLQQQPAARPTALQVLSRLRALVEGGAKPPSPGRINTAPRAASSDPVAYAPDTPDAMGVLGASPRAPRPAASPAAANAAKPPLPRPITAIQLRPTPPSPFAS
ncbi:hypothetical protein COHA_007387 [Chlorella ohadii]|uniref:non-specific serine/threonine protein kinase n=1 Tax=Chlorella ohadii TaxID=2649997 RepID=A0AAD5DN60_9CHLO|nr:hypothetical protein COHA_007387 [Chlorella ohadii]